jgi:hypothetical protein
MENPESLGAMLIAALIGGAELRYAVHRVSKRLKDMERRVSSLETPKADSWKYPTVGPRKIGLMILACLLFVGGCTQADIERAQQLADSADAKLVAAKQAVDAAESLATATNSEKALAAVAAANAALAVAVESADAGHKAVASAKQSQAAGATTFNVLLAAATALIPAVGGILASVNSAVKSAQALRQTVAGIDNAKRSLSPEAVALLHSELAKAQDESTKDRVDAAQAANGA